ncbi:MAG: hypothetical protein WB729_17600 [Candidatus Sulfotelmatobacter sp.]
MNELLERSKFFREHVASVLNLATGALVLSVTFLHNEEGHLKQTWLLERCWIFSVRHDFSRRGLQLHAQPLRAKRWRPV